MFVTNIKNIVFRFSEWVSLIWEHLGNFNSVASCHVSIDIIGSTLKYSLLGASIILFFIGRGVSTATIVPKTQTRNKSSIETNNGGRRQAGILDSWYVAVCHSKDKGSAPEESGSSRSVLLCLRHAGQLLMTLWWPSQPISLQCVGLAL